MATIKASLVPHIFFFKNQTLNFNVWRDWKKIRHIGGERNRRVKYLDCGQCFFRSQIQLFVFFVKRIINLKKPMACGSIFLSLFCLTKKPLHSNYLDFMGSEFDAHVFFFRCWFWVALLFYAFAFYKKNGCRKFKQFVILD